MNVIIFILPPKPAAKLKIINMGENYWNRLSMWSWLISGAQEAKTKDMKMGWALGHLVTGSSCGGMISVIRMYCLHV